MSLERLKSVFSGIGNNLGSTPGGRHGGTEGPTPAQPPHPEEHTLFDDGAGQFHIPINNSAGVYGVIQGRFGGTEGPFPAQPPHPAEHSIFDDIENNVSLYQNNQPLPDGSILSPMINGYQTGLSSFYPDTIGAYFGPDNLSPENLVNLNQLHRGKSYNWVTGEEFTSYGKEHSFAGTTRIPEQVDGNYQFRTQTFDPRDTKPGTVVIKKGYAGSTFMIGDGGVAVDRFGMSSLQFFTTDFSTAGKQDDAFSNLGSLGQGLYNGENSDLNQSWQNLYNADHSSKDSPSWQGITPISYPNVGRERNLNIRSETGDAPGNIFSFSRTQGFGGGAGEPYIVSEIPTKEGLYGGRANNAGNQMIPIVRALGDAVRLTKYLSSPAGLAFIAKQNLLIGTPMNVIRDDDNLKRVPQRHHSFYNPLSTPLAAGLRLVGMGLPNPLPFRTDPQINIPFTDLELFDEQEYPKTGEHTIEQTFERGDQPGGAGGNWLSNYFSNLGSMIPGGTENPTVPKHITGDRMTLAKMIQGVELATTTNSTVAKTATGVSGSLLAQQDTELGFDLESEANGMPFYFKDMRDSTYIFFRAYIEGITENVSPSWTPTNYVGRSEPVYIYERAEREISFNIRLVAQTKSELKMLRQKINRLTSMCYPEYVASTGDPNKLRMKPPLVKMRLGELFGRSNNEMLGFLNTISYTVDGGTTWETENGKRVPRHITATVVFKVIHESPPDKSTEFYGYLGNT